MQHKVLCLLANPTVPMFPLFFFLSFYNVQEKLSFPLHEDSTRRTLNSKAGQELTDKLTPETELEKEVAKVRPCLNQSIKF